MLYKIGLSENREITVETEKSPGDLAVWANGVCEEPGFAICNTPEGKAAFIRIREIQTITEV